jgi:hypothetical protein
MEEITKTMCIICLDIEKNKLSPSDAQWALAEVASELSNDHYQEVLQKIEDLEAKRDFKILLKLATTENTTEKCATCHCDPCDCLWGTNE